MSDGSDFYTLPAERIAQEPPKQRGKSRLLVVSRTDSSLHDAGYADLADYVQPGDVVIINDTRVIKARLQAKLVGGGQRELFLTERHAGPMFARTGRVLYRGKLRVGDQLTVGEESLEVTHLYGHGQAAVRSTLPLDVIAEQYGHVPLPPYMKRAARRSDVDRYQTVFAKRTGSVAAPTASLNLTAKLLTVLRAKGVTIAPLTLHVGRGTFLPIRTPHLQDHVMHEEYFVIPTKTVEAIRAAKQRGGKVVAIGTTVTRALEYAAEDVLKTVPATRLRGEANIFIYPGYEFQVVDCLLTNFHAPDSTVLQLAAAFAGEGLLKAAYEHALKRDYRFLSYGDSMLIL